MNSLRRSKSNYDENSKFNEDSYDSDNNTTNIDNLCHNLRRKRERGNSIISSSSSFSFKAPLTISSKTQSIISAILSKKSKSSTINYKPPTLSLPMPSIKQEKTSTKPSTFKISQRTLDVINKLKIERQNRFNRENSVSTVKSVESSFSLRFKYEDLIKEQRELPLPLKYKALLNIFIELDNIIDATKTLKNIIPTFKYLVSTIEITYHHRFTLDMLKQILYLVPKLLIYRYNKIENDYELIIDIPRSFDEKRKNEENSNKFDPMIAPMTVPVKEKRAKALKNALLEMVKDYHTKFLNDNNIPQFDPFTVKTWHHDFELNSVSDIPLAEIEPKPNMTNKFEDCVKKNDIKALLIEEDEKKELLKVDENENDSKILKFVSKEFMNKLKKKELLNTISKEATLLTDQQHKEKSKNEIIKEIIEQINTVFICAKRDSLEWDDFIEKLINSSNKIKQNVNKEETMNIVKKICKLFPHWIRIKQHSLMGMIIVREDKLDLFQEVLHNIQLINKDL